MGGNTGMDFINLYGIILYFGLFLTAAVTFLLYLLSDRVVPNFMTKAAKYLLGTLALNCLGILVLRMAILTNCILIHEQRDAITLIPRTLLLIALINFLNNTIRKRK